MAKKFPSGRCVHCLQHFDKLTSDHAFPKSWYPDTTQENLEKWQFPACDECNRKYGKLENDLLLRLGLCLDPRTLESLGIPEKALRSVDLRFAKDERDREHRQKRKEKILREIDASKNFPEESILPEFGPHVGFELHQQGVIPVSVTELKLLGEKLVRGVSFVQDKRFIEPDHRIEVFLVGEIDPRPFIELLNRFGKEDECGPGIKVKMASIPSDPQSGVFEFKIWGKLTVYATVEAFTN